MGADAARRRVAHYRGVRAAAWRARLRADGLPCNRGAQVHACVVARVAGASRCGAIAARCRCRRRRRFCRGGRACEDDAAAAAKRRGASERGRAAALIRPGTPRCSHPGAGVALELPALAPGCAWRKNGQAQGEGRPYKVEIGRTRYSQRDFLEVKEDSPKAVPYMVSWLHLSPCSHGQRRHAHGRMDVGCSSETQGLGYLDCHPKECATFG